MWGFLVSDNWIKNIKYISMSSWWHLKNQNLKNKKSHWSLLEIVNENSFILKTSV